MELYDVYGIDLQMTKEERRKAKSDAKLREKEDRKRNRQAPSESSCDKGRRLFKEMIEKQHKDIKGLIRSILTSTSQMEEDSSLIKREKKIALAISNAVDTIRSEILTIPDNVLITPEEISNNAYADLIEAKKLIDKFRGDDYYEYNRNDTLRSNLHYLIEFILNYNNFPSWWKSWF